MLTVLLAVSAMAEVNPTPGYIITNSCDTIYGTIDFRTNSKNTLQCEFKEKDTYTTYLPGEILGYRLTSNGKYYLSKTVSINGKDEKVFAEFLVKGEVSIYYVCFDGEDLYFFENEVDGKIVSYNPDSMSDAQSVSRQELKNRMYPLFDFMRKSRKASNSIRFSPMDRGQLVGVVKSYNYEVCGPDGCIEFEYDEKSDLNPVRYKVYAGVKFCNISASTGKTFTSYSDNALFPFIGGGVDICFPRIAKGLLLQGELTIAYVNMEKHYGTRPLVHDITDANKGFMCEVNVGPAYEFQTSGKFRPMLRAGGNLNYINASWETVCDGRKTSMWPSRLDGVSVGVYGGAGLVYNVGKGDAILEATYHFNKGANEVEGRYNTIEILLGYRF